jgi:hypothetical protein
MPNHVCWLKVRCHHSFFALFPAFLVDSLFRGFVKLVVLLVVLSVPQLRISVGGRQEVQETHQSQRAGICRLADELGGNTAK